jgi:hypothetical protein
VITEEQGLTAIRNAYLFGEPLGKVIRNLREAGVKKSVITKWVRIVQTERRTKLHNYVERRLREI